MAQVRTPEQDAVTPAPEGAGAREPVSARPRATLAARMLRRDGRFAAAIVAVLAASAFALTMGGAAMRPATPPPAGSAAPTATVAATATPARVTAQVVPANERRYDLPGPNAGLMQPAVDARGDVWFGEMNTN